MTSKSWSSWPRAPTGDQARRHPGALAGLERGLRLAAVPGAGAEGADSIVISGGYEDDSDEGDTIIYTGHGGNNPATGGQVGHQALERGNMALVKSCEARLPVRVIRGARGHPLHSPTSGYRYDGLYYVEGYWQKQGKAGYNIWQFRLVKVPDDAVGA